GDRAVREVLDVYETVRQDGFGVPLRVEHAQHLDPADLDRFRSLGVIASMQPIHATSDFEMADRLLGARARWSYAFKSLLAAGATVRFGSDCPVETLDPWAGIHAAVTRQRADEQPIGGWFPEERLTVEEALGCYVSSDAQNRVHDEAGLRPDWVVLSSDLFSISPREILSIRVEQTIVAGRLVFSS
ncbi:MAG: amidohydrolase family protein, partial [Chloroflexi bacterium]|nr:amidohydrolase family protein [Chloroflexota bacterium]